MAVLFAHPDVRATVSALVEPVAAVLQAEPALVRAVRAHLDEPGSLERAARTAGVHRHTLRAHLRAAEKATGLDLASADDRLLLTLALRIGGDTDRPPTG